MRGAADLDRALSVARAHKNRLIQEVSLELICGAENFDHTSGFRFANYASEWIRQAINRAISDSSRSIRLPSHVNDMACCAIRGASALLGSVVPRGWRALACLPLPCSLTSGRGSGVLRTCLRVRQFCQSCIVDAAACLVAGSTAWVDVRHSSTGFRVSHCCLLPCFWRSRLPARVDRDEIDGYRVVFYRHGKRFGRNDAKGAHGILQ